MTNLNDLVEDIEDTTKLIRDSTNKEAKQFYVEHIEEVIIDEAPEEYKDFLFKYWNECKEKYIK